MTRGTRTVYPGKRNKELSSTFQPPEEDRSVQQPKRSDKRGDKDEDNSSKNVNNVNLPGLFIWSISSNMSIVIYIRSPHSDEGINGCISRNAKLFEWIKHFGMR